METVAADSALRSYSDRFRPRRFDLPAHGPGFSGAIILRVETEAGPFCLRGWPPDTAEPARLRGLHRLLGHLQSCGIDFVAVPVPATNGKTLVRSGDRWWQLEPWLPGQADFNLRPSKTRLAAAMTALARLHRAATTFDPGGREETWFGSQAETVAPAISDRVERLSGWTADKRARLRASLRDLPGSESRYAAVATTILEYFERCAPVIAHELNMAQPLRVPVQPCLRDLWHDHILFLEDIVSGIIDPSAGRTDTVAADLARLLGSLIGDDRRSWETALDAYQHIRPLSSEERTLIEVLDRSGLLLSGMTWLSRRLLSGVPFEQPQRVVERLEKIAGRLEVLSRTIPERNRGMAPDGLTWRPRQIS